MSRPSPTAFPDIAGNMSRRLLLAGAGAALLPGRRLMAASQGTLRIGDQNKNLQSLLEVAGEIPKSGYTVEWEEFTQGQQVMHALNAGALDLAYAGDIVFLFSYASGAPVRAVGGSSENGASAGILVNGRSDIRSVGDLRGKRIALSRAGLGEPLLYGALARAGLAPSAVRIVNLSQIVARVALAHGEVDAWVSWEPYVALAEIVDGARMIADARDILPSRAFAIAHTDAIASRPELIRDMQQRVARATNWALANPDKAAGTLARVSGLPLDVALKMVATSRRHPINIDAQVIQDTRKLCDTLLAEKLLQQPIDVSSALDPDFPVALDAVSHPI